MDREPEEDIAPWLEVVDACQLTGSLPRAGGVLDQDSREMFILYHGLRSLKEREGLEAKRNRR